MSAAKIKKGDEVVVLSGKDKGKTGTVTEAMPKVGKVIVSGVNMMTRHRKASQANPQGGLERIEAAMFASKVAIKDPATGKPTRVGFTVAANGHKVRVAKGSGEIIDKELAARKAPATERSGVKTNG